MRGTENIQTAIKRWFEGVKIRPEALYLVGGSVRDLLMGRPLKDLDLVCRGAKDLACAVANNRDAAVVPLQKNPDEPCYRVVDRSGRGLFLDIAEMRGRSIYDDLGLRDFTINAMALKVSDYGIADKIIDPLHGADDISRRLIRASDIGVLTSDPLRVLRAVRFSAELGFAIENKTLTEMRKAVGLLSRVSSERIMSELLLILNHPESAAFFRQMDELGILQVLFPEISEMKACIQNGYHHLDVWNHSLLVMENAENILNSPEDYFGEDASLVMHSPALQLTALLKLTALLHDVGKPATKAVNPGSGRITFYGHEKTGAGLIDVIALRMKMSGSQREFMTAMISNHLRPIMLYSPKATNAAKMRWFRKMGDGSVPALVLAMADVMGSQGPESGEAYRRGFVIWAAGMVREYLLSTKMKLARPLPVSGSDLLEMGMQPGPEVGRILRRIRAAQDNDELHTQQQALDLVKHLIADMAKG